MASDEGSGMPHRAVLVGEPASLEDLAESHKFGGGADDPFGWGVDVPAEVEPFRPEECEVNSIALFGRTVRRADFVAKEGAMHLVLHLGEDSLLYIGARVGRRDARQQAAGPARERELRGRFGKHPITTRLTLTEHR